MTSIRRLGSSGMLATPLGLGLAALGRPGYINLGRETDLSDDRSPAALRRRCHEVLDAAWDEGIRYFDAARSYGRAEEFLGQWLRDRDIEPDEVTVASKWGYRYTAGWRVEAEIHEVKEHSLTMLRRQWRETRQELGDHLYLYQIHSATRESGVLRDPAVLAELAELRERTGVRIGLTTSGPRQAETIREALAVEIDGTRLFQTVQATWNLLEPSAGAALAEAAAAEMGVVVKEALANGRLAGRSGSAEGSTISEVVGREADRLGTTPDALALSAAMRQPWAHVVLSGAATVEQVRANAAARSVRWDDEAAETLTQLAEPPLEYWERRSRLPWR